MKEKWRQYLTEKSVRIALAAVAAVLLLSGGGVVYAKYFSQGARYGIAIASGVYFTANHATENEEFMESLAKTGYSGGDTDYYFEVRNYENNLLFNESTVEIPYSVSFWLGETPVGGNYSVTPDGGVAQPLIAGEENKVTIDGQTVTGGAALANSYKIQISGTTDNSHKPVPVYVLVETDAGSIIRKTLRGKMVLNKTSVSGEYIEHQGFVLSTDTDDTEEQFAQMEKQSLLSYEIRTGGETQEVTEQIKLSWNPDLLEIDLFDDAYLNRSAGIITEDGWSYIIINVMPYSAQTIGFFRADGYEEAVTSMDALNAAIRAEVHVAVN